MKLSILICSVINRLELRADLLKLLRNSIGPHTSTSEYINGCLIEKFTGEQAEIIVATDTKVLSVGDKRNLLIDLASGTHLSFIDDDDMVTTDYVSLLLYGLESDPDVVVFRAIRYENGVQDREVLYGKQYGRDYTKGKYYYRLPNHLMCIRTSIAKQVRFKGISFGEDADYAKRVLPYLKKQVEIPAVLYEYWFDKQITETQK